MDIDRIALHVIIASHTGTLAIDTFACPQTDNHRYLIPITIRMTFSQTIVCIYISAILKPRCLPESSASDLYIVYSIYVQLHKLVIALISLFLGVTGKHIDVIAVDTCLYRLFLSLQIVQKHSLFLRKHTCIELIRIGQIHIIPLQRSNICLLCRLIF